MIRQQLIDFGRVNKNNRVYTKESIKSLPEHVKVFRDNEDGWEDRNPIGTAKIEQRDDGVYAEVWIDHGMASDAIRLLEIGAIKVVTAGLGNVKPLDGGAFEVTDFELTGTFITCDPS